MHGVRRRPLISEINVVPYIDVMLVLLIIFMVTVPLIQQGVEISLPEVDGKPVSGEDGAPLADPLIVTVERDGKMWVNRQGFGEVGMSLQEVTEVLQQLLPENRYEVFLRADDHARYGDVVKVLVAVQELFPEGESGGRTVGLITAPIPDEKNF